MTTENTIEEKIQMENKRMKNKQFTSKEVSIRLHNLTFAKPSKYFYEWTGADRIDEFKSPCWYLDGINVYTANQMARELPKNCAINENVVEFGLLPTDNLATKRAKVICYLIEKGIMDNRFLLVSQNGGSKA